jgi:hypothetical protein
MSTDPPNPSGDESALTSSPTSNAAAVKESVPESLSAAIGQAESKQSEAGKPTPRENVRADLAKWLVFGYFSAVSAVLATVLANGISWYWVISPSLKLAETRTPPVTQVKPSPGEEGKGEVDLRKQILEMKEKQDQTAKDIFALVLTSVSGAVGSALGFYFSTRDTD